jgi:hypothetical protein
LEVVGSAKSKIKQNGSFLSLILYLLHSIFGQAIDPRYFQFRPFTHELEDSFFTTTNKQGKISHRPNLKEIAEYS